MGYRKVINRMKKAQQKHGKMMIDIGDVQVEFSYGSVNHCTETHNVCVEAYNTHVHIWNKLQGYINQLSKKAPKPCTTKTT